MSIKPIPTLFVVHEAHLTWADAIWGIENGWAEPNVLIELAICRVLDEVHSSIELELAGLMPGQEDSAIALARKLVALEHPDHAVNPAAIWLCICLRWLFENRTRLSDPLAIVEELYADFDYPPEVAPFVRYMPAEGDYDPEQHSLAENEGRLYEEWRTFLTNCERRLD